MQTAVRRAIEAMWNRYYEPLGLADLADEAILSRFYFSRLFQHETGTSPGRFLAAVRLYKAKNLLLETSLTVTEISLKVGYNSLGTFTSRFTNSVGVPPGRYRSLARNGMPDLMIPRPREPHARGALTGALHVHEIDVPMRVYVGAFAGILTEGHPICRDVISCDAMADPRGYRLVALPDGDWFIQAVAVATEDVDPRPWCRQPLFVGNRRRVRVDGHAGKLDLDLHPIQLTDLPILAALPELDSLVPPRADSTGKPLVRSDARGARCVPGNQLG